MARQTKTSQIQLRVTPREKAELVKRARHAGMDLSAWMLERLLPQKGARFRTLVRELGDAVEPAFALAELGDLLTGLGRSEFGPVLEMRPEVPRDPVRANQLAAMIEVGAARLGERLPAWVAEIAPLAVPWFSTSLVSLRLHLLCNSPAAFRRRNLFVDSTLGDRV